MLANKLLFIGGAPKSGTTYLFKLLSQSEEVAASALKETCFFLDKDYPLINQDKNFHNQSLDFFLKEYYKNDVCSPKFFLEGTPHLIWQKDMPTVLKKYNPKLIFILRDPVRRVYSSFNFSKNNLGLLKKDLSFTEFVEICLNPKENQNHFLFKSKNLEILRNEIKHSQYYPYLRTWKNQIHKKNLHILQFEKFIERPQLHLDLLLQRLNIATFPIENNHLETNSTYEVKSVKFHFFTKKISEYLPEFFKPIAKRGYFFLQKKSKKNDLDDQRGLDLLRVYYQDAYKILADEFELKWEDR